MSNASPATFVFTEAHLAALTAPDQTQVRTHVAAVERLEYLLRYLSNTPCLPAEIDRVRSCAEFLDEMRRNSQQILKTFHDIAERKLNNGSEEKGSNGTDSNTEPTKNVRDPRSYGDSSAKGSREKSSGGDAEKGSA